MNRNDLSRHGNPSLFEAERVALAKLRRLVTERAAAEGRIAAAWQQAADEAEKEVARARKQIANSRSRSVAEAEASYETLASTIITKYEQRQSTTDAKRIEDLRLSLSKFEEANEKTRSVYKDRLWTIDSLLEAGEKELQDSLQKVLRKADAGKRRADSSWAGVDPVLDKVRLSREEIAFGEAHLPSPTDTDPDGYMVKKLEELERAGAKIETALGPKIVHPITRLVSKNKVRRLGSAFGVFQAEALRAVRLLQEYGRKTFERGKSDMLRQNANDRKRATDQFEPLLKQIQSTKDAEFESIESDHDDKTAQIIRDRQTETRSTDAKHDATLKAIAEKFDVEAKTAETRYQAKWNEAASLRDRDWNAMNDAWQRGIGEVHGVMESLKEFGAARFPEWATAKDPAWQLPASVPEGIRYGELNVDMYALPDGEPMDARLVPAEPVRTVVPAFLPFPDKASVLLKADDNGRNEAIKAVQAMMLRFLTGLPAGKCRFVIIDPVGLGENFASFMHLADVDEKLVGARIWTEPRQIDQRLTDLTEHMENVIQKYLRNQYRSIEDYNRAAGEVAEPYRVLVVANFPANFTPDSARRLVSIMQSGPACGVCTLLTVDSKAPMPRDFRLADLELAAFNLHWDGKSFVPTDADLKAFPLTLDTPPEGPVTSAIIKRVGEASREAGKVEVPFEFIMPLPEKVWTSSSAKGLEVPIGRAGATKRQYLSLGKGTAQHTLIVGKTGSGKSTLLHALITNIALHYSPDELELYLIDFKEGVEFKMYAANALPHARVVAIESEREFGLSVLQRLDGILRERGEAFRDAGANDVSSYREATGKVVPRILLVIDEFQILFVEDDKLSNEAAQLIDRLVRQGRAFGMHVILGSQTLGGSNSLPRSTMDQMAVRIALQCSDADAQMILSKDNTAARLLSRPGEAIYNDANGLVEGNDPFQVVWLNEDHRERLLSELKARAGGAYPPPLVFEGNKPAVLAENKFLLAGRASDGVNTTVTAWLGDAVAIKDPTAAVFRGQSASNLLLIGQQEQAALAITVSAIVGLLPQVGREAFTILDGTPDDNEHADYLRQAAQALGLDAVVDRTEISTALAKLQAEYERRQRNETSDRSPRFLVVHALSRFRELRKTEDDYGFKKNDGPKPPGDIFAGLLRDGPAFGIHTIVWCDSLMNFNRALDRQALREFGQRVLFQMSAQDSSHLLDTPAANRLDKNRALFTLEDQAKPEKFRPYGLPEIEWLKSLR